MKITIGSLTRIMIKGIHNGCWSTDERVKHSIRVLDFRIMNNNYLRMLILIHNEDRKPLLDRLKNTYRIFILTSITKYSKDKLVLSFVKNLNSISVPRMIDKYQGFFLKAIYSNGIEKWDFLIPNKYINSIIDSLKSVISNMEVKVQRYEPVTDIDLTPKEREILEKALKLGYFEFPRNISLEELSKSLGLSPSTLIYHLRNIEKKVMARLLSEQHDRS